MSAWRVAGPSSFARRGRAIPRADLLPDRTPAPARDRSATRLLAWLASWLAPPPTLRRRAE